MTFKTHEITVDLVNATPTKELRFSQGDRNSAKFVLNITNLGQELDLSQAKAVRITFKKSDGTTVFQQDCQVINALKGKYQIVLKTQTLAAIGNVYAQVRIFEDDRELDAEPFVFTVKQSYSGDTAVESTNEFTIIQKAIEAGKKLEGVDIDGIIAAGAKADAALPKAGGVLTGNVDMDVAVGSKSKGVRWKDATGTLFGIESSTTGELILYDYKSAARIWQYDPVAKRFTVLSDTNLLKTTGGTITGNVVLEGARDFIFKNDNSEIYFRNNSSGIFAFYDKKNDFVPWSYDPATKKFNVGAVNTNVMKNTGDTMTGDLRIRKDGAAIYLETADGSRVCRIFYNANTASDSGLNIQSPSGKLLLRDGNNVTREVATKEKDGRATITPTADAELTSPDGIIADRRGSTVTLRARIRRKSEQVNTVFVMPADMRPLLTVTTNIVSNDGVVGAFSIATNGDVKIASVGPTLLNKDFNITITYVVD
ncbi:BppU family phage baseplate upper protein [Bacillus mobilis]|uniref:BppU family phage baseplate upper protein n=1 Tax=Bacillus mobilis TaxID=2026190 RepID=UPI002FDBC6FA